MFIENSEPANAHYTSASLIEMEFLALYMTLNEDIRKQIGHQFQDFIQDCTYRGTSCKNER